MTNGVGSWIVKHCNRFADKTAIVYKEKQFTYEQLNVRVNRLAHALLDIGVRKGDRVDALLFNTNEMLEAMFACAKIGAIYVPINFRLSVDEVEYIVRDSSPHHFIYDERMKPLVDQLRERMTFISDWIHVGQHPHKRDLQYDQLLAGSKDEEPGFDIGLDDVHMMMYTSGTTGNPKGAMISHGNTLWNAINSIHFRSIDAEDTTLAVAPMFHIGAMGVSATPLLYKGGTVVLEDQFDPRAVLELVQTEKLSSLFMVPAMWMAMTQVPNFDDYDLSSIKYNISGGAPCPITVIEFFQQRNIPFYEGFGLTETAPSVSLLDPENSFRKNGSIGKPLFHVEVKIIDHHGRQVPTGEVGELLIKGPNVFVGYWNQPEKTKEALQNGWFHSGDLATFDDEGFLYIVDRKKDMVISGGENVYPIEVEQVLFRHPNIKEAGVVGVPDEKWGETPKAFVVLEDKNQTLTLEDIESFCEGKLARFKIPKVIEIIEELPRNATGKVLKMALRKGEKGQVK
ncbi:o-succinylbenzoate--CoA ligase [Salicibibacter cibarius]|uniref:O-succinylbenzoate--CoA ligase n=1 Tax=Salicibibacter cibarius TaxID=2743000 RepID=A0A7T6Z1I8_9BACI|nr:o-succinylbenzoate--CoA ligase [Salicibibacter cibarius]QQK74576.1 o-succinylbenzoate--CoA ligase [Salicibibacter cibarius]